MNVMICRVVSLSANIVGNSGLVQMDLPAQRICNNLIQKSDLYRKLQVFSSRSWNKRFSCVPPLLYVVTKRTYRDKNVIVATILIKMSTYMTLVLPLYLKSVIVLVEKFSSVVYTGLLFTWNKRFNHFIQSTRTTNGYF